MSKLEVLRLPLMDAEGCWITLPNDQWNVTMRGTGFITLSSRSGLNHTLGLGSLMAIELGSEEQVTSIGKTIGRMALTGAGAALFSKGRSGGVGAGLLDLSIRGAEKNTVVSGLMVFVDSTILKFRLAAKDFDALASSVPEYAFSPDAFEASREMFDLLQRMQDDGERVLPELLGRIVDSKQRMHALLIETDGGETFAARDAARQALTSAKNEFQRDRLLFTALLFDLKIDPGTFFETRDDRETILGLGSSISGGNPDQNDSVITETGASTPFFKTRRGLLITAFIVIIVFLWMLARASTESVPGPKVQADRPIARDPFAGVQIPTYSDRPATMPAHERPSEQGSGAQMAQWRADVAARVRSSAATFSGDGSGVSTVTFTVSATGAITDISGGGIAASVIRRLGSVPPPPGGREMHLSVPVRVN